MKVVEQVKNSFYEIDMDQVFTREEIVDRVVLKYNTNSSSVIPSDYCYNRTNNDIQKRFSKQLHIFEYMKNGRYKYLGENYPYVGNIYHLAKGEEEQIVGKWINNEPNFFD